VVGQAGGGGGLGGEGLPGSHSSQELSAHLEAMELYVPPLCGALLTATWSSLMGERELIERGPSSLRPTPRDMHASSSTSGACGGAHATCADGRGGNGSGGAGGSGAGLAGSPVGAGLLAPRALAPALTPASGAGY
jgi:hypothetical protein